MDDTLEEVVRATTRQGSGKPPRRLELWLPILGLCAWGVLAYAIAARTFRWVPTN